MKRLFVYLFVLTLSAGAVFAQDNVEQNLAYQYYREGAYDKAADIFERLYNKNPGTKAYYRYLYNSLLFIKNYDELEKLVKKNIKKFSDDLSYRVDLGYFYLQKGDISKGKNEYNDAIKNLEPDETQIIQLANAFMNYQELDLAAKTYEKGQQMEGDRSLFALELAEIYEKLNNPKKAIQNYLIYIDGHTNKIQMVKNLLQQTIQKREYANEFQSQLLSRIQKYPQVVQYPQLLIWHYTQQKNFKAALIQAKAMDRRLKENGYRLVNLARSATKEKDYEVAIKAYEYVIDRGKESPFYMKSKKELLSTYKKKITNSLDYTDQDLIDLTKRFDLFIAEFGVNRNTASTIREKAQLLAFYLDDYDEAITLLEELLNYPSIDRKLKGEFKLELGDFYIMKEEIWEAALLYGQVDKEFGDEPLGEMARFKNAKLSYYKGEFEWAEAQLNILKASTSELISNDAIDLSVFIMDNLGLDTTLYPMEKFARADLLYYQHKLDDAVATLDSVHRIFPNHSLTDDIFFMKAKIFMKKKDYAAAIPLLEKIIEKFSDDILGDDATFNLAEIYHFKLKDNDKAQQLYQDLIFKYQDSIYIVEARKRFRELRGDQL